MQTSQINSEKIVDILTSSDAVWFIFGLFLLFFVVVSIILVYHWKKYGYTSKHIAFAEIIYFPVAFILIGLVSFSLLMYGNI